MNREIKFRAWNGNNIVDLYQTTPLALKDDLKIDGVFVPFGVNWEIMQYTGLKDKKGVEIYEGDICKANNWTLDENFILDIEEEYFIGNVYFSNHWFGFAISENGSDSPICHIAELEVIGNIYENPDLLIKTLTQ